MGTGYVRNDTANNIADGNIINASDLDGEFDAVQSAFDASTGHTHDGTVGEGAPIETIGPTQDVVATASVLRPKTDNTVDLGTTTLEYKDLFLDGTAHIDTLDVDENASITGTLGVTGTTTLGTANITTGTITTADINGGNIDGTIIGATTAAAITGTTITGTSFVTSGDMTFGDNDKAIFGAGSDLQIYHDGSNSYIVDNGTGDLHLSAANFYITNPANTENHLSAINNGAVTLYYDNSTKLATTSTGVDITGTLTSDGLEIDGKVLINAPADTLAQEIRGRSSDDVGYLQFSNNAGTTSSYIGSNGSYLNFEVGSAERMRIANNGDISLYEDTGTTAKFFWDASAESLGIGTTSPSQLAHLYESTAATGAFMQVQEVGGQNAYFGVNTSGGSIQVSGANPLQIATNGTERMRIDSSGNLQLTSVDQDIEFNATTTAHESRLKWNYGGTLQSWIEREHSDGSMVFGNQGSEAMRIDSSGNLLVGKTAATISTDGAELRPTGEVVATTNGLNVAYFNRRSSDGSIAEFRKDGATVGSIGAVSGDMYIGTGDTGLRFHDGNNVVYPANQGAVVDANLDIGDANYRWKDLFLSGGVYLGGTGSANLLDDYEEGTWTPTLPNGGTISVSRATYIKIGRLVHVQFQADITPTNNSSQFRIGGLPFITTSTSSSYSVGSLGYSGGLDVSGWNQPLVEHNGGDYLYFQVSTASTSAILNSAFAGSTRNFIISANYEANS
jgi:hypothetical protein